MGDETSDVVPVTAETPDPDQGHARQWPSTPYSDIARAPAPSPEAAFCIALLGDCTVACTYLPLANRPENHLAARLRRTYPERQFLVRNLGADGECAEDILRPNRWALALDALPHLDVAFLRYGINDRKRHGIEDCVANLAGLCDTLERQFVGVQLFIETGIWVDYPAHYLWDRNARLGPLYAAIRTFTQARGYGLVDIFANMADETQCGNWDLRVRGLPNPDHLIVDDTFDVFYGDDPAFFTNIHPNSRCLSLIAEWEMVALKNTLERASTGQ
jgi:acyl-CoA thioesterase-1